MGRLPAADLPEARLTQPGRSPFVAATRNPVVHPDLQTRRDVARRGPGRVVATDRLSDDAVRRFLGTVADTLAGSGDRKLVPLRPGVDETTLARWLIRSQLAAMTYPLARQGWPSLAARLRRDALGVAAGNLSHFEALTRVEKLFRERYVPFVVLKGAALAEATYGDACRRSMSDIDIWVRGSDMPTALRLLREIGFRPAGARQDRPPALQRLSGGEIQFCSPERTYGLVELHGSAFAGWWMRHAASVDEAAMWRRAKPITPGRFARSLAPEDAVVQIACHIAVHQFGQAPLRGLMDIALLARRDGIDWDKVARRSESWGLGTMVWAVLDLLERWVGAPGLDPALERLRPRGPHRLMLRMVIRPRSILNGRVPHPGRSRYLLLLLLADRFRDMARLVWRSLWPERSWLAARYDEPVGRLQHLWLLLRRGEI